LVSDSDRTWVEFRTIGQIWSACRRYIYTLNTCESEAGVSDAPQIIIRYLAHIAATHHSIERLKPIHCIYGLVGCIISTSVSFWFASSQLPSHNECYNSGVVALHLAQHFVKDPNKFCGAFTVGPDLQHHTISWITFWQTQNGLSQWWMLDNWDLDDFYLVRNNLFEYIVRHEMQF
jgi:hypothetical protein